MFNRKNKNDKEPTRPGDLLSRMLQPFDDFFDHSFFGRSFFSSEWTPKMNEKMEEEGRVYWGFSRFVGPDGVPQTKFWGNVNPPKALGNRPGKVFSLPSEAQKQVRDPAVDIITEDGHLRAIVELPGVSKDQISLKGQEYGIQLEAKSETYNYSKWIEFGTKIDQKAIKTTFANGVLEINVETASGRKNENGFDIKIN